MIEKLGRLVISKQAQSRRLWHNCSTKLNGPRPMLVPPAEEPTLYRHTKRCELFPSL